MNTIVQQKARELTFHYFSVFQDEFTFKNVEFEKHIEDTMDWNITLEEFIEYELIKLAKIYNFNHFQFGIDEEATKLIKENIGKDLLNGIRKEYIYEIERMVSEEMEELKFLKENVQYLLEKKDLLEPDTDDHYSDKERTEAILEDQKAIQNLEQEIIKKQLWKKSIQKAELVCA